MDTFEEKSFLTSRSLTYHYYISKSVGGAESGASKKTLLLLHGWPTSSQLWEDVVPYLLPLLSSYQIIIPDILGFGKTSKPTDSKTYDGREMTTDIVEMLSHENAAKEIVLIGHDFGAWFAQHIYHYEPSRCLAVILLAVGYTPPNIGPVMPTLEQLLAMTEQAAGYPRFAYVEFFVSPTAPSILRNHLESLYTLLHGDRKDMIKTYYCQPGAFEKYLVSDSRTPLKKYAQTEAFKNRFLAQFENDPHAFEGPQCYYTAFTDGVQYEAEKQHLQPKDLVIEVPVLFVACSGDAVNPLKTIEEPKDQGLLPDLTATELDCGHYCPWEKPAEVANEILKFLEAKVH